MLDDAEVVLVLVDPANFLAEAQGGFPGRQRRVGSVGWTLAGRWRGEFGAKQRGQLTREVAVEGLDGEADGVELSLEPLEAAQHMIAVELHATTIRTGRVKSGPLRRSVRGPKASEDPWTATKKPSDLHGKCSDLDPRESGRCVVAAHAFSIGRSGRLTRLVPWLSAGGSTADGRAAPSRHDTSLIAYVASSVQLPDLALGRRQAGAVCDVGMRSPGEIERVAWRSRPRDLGEQLPRPNGVLFGERVVSVGVMGGDREPR